MSTICEEKNAGACEGELALGVMGIADINHKSALNNEIACGILADTQDRNKVMQHDGVIILVPIYKTEFRMLRPKLNVLAIEFNTK